MQMVSCSQTEREDVPYRGTRDIRIQHRQTKTMKASHVLYHLDAMPRSGSGVCGYVEKSQWRRRYVRVADVRARDRLLQEAKD